MTTPVYIETDPWGRALAWLRVVLESALDWIFSLKHSAGLYRNIVRSMGFLLFYIYSVAVLYDYNQWQALFANLFPTTIASNPNLLIINLGVLAFSTVLHPEVLRHLLALAAPYMLIHRLAAVYMADIFEKDAAVARRFINQAAFAEDYLTIRVRAGTLVESNHDSPIVQIGGPGYVTVELDSAAVFESHDGTVRVIGPTSKMPHGRAVVEDFERLRQCIDLRDIIDRQEVTSRSRDGILVKARDIQYSYSVYRGENLQKTLTLPYPFEEESIKRMVKAVIVPVSPGKQADTRPEWTRPLPGRLFVSINIEFSNFIGRNGLSEFFSSIGSPEEDALRQQGERLGKDAQALAGNEGQSSNDDLLKAGSFKHRPKLAEDMFKSNAFINFMKAKGLQVNWIGVGIWQTPSQIIPENHLDAWKTSQENKRLSSPEQLNRLYRETHANTLIQLVNQLPLSPYYRLYNEMEQGQKTETQVIEVILEQYLSYLRNISKHFEDHQQSPPESIMTALEAVGLLQYHQVGSDYYVCIKTTSRPGIDIQGAMICTIEVAFSSYPLPGYIPHPVMFDFGDRQQLDFAFSVNVPNLIVEPFSPQILTMQRDELYVRAHFQVSIFLDTSTDALIDVEQNGSNIAHLLVTLTD